jgi:hypothetical protein
MVSSEWRVANRECVSTVTVCEVRAAVRKTQRTRYSLLPYGILLTRTWFLIADQIKNEKAEP